jgi:hypothetical protein
LRRSLGGLLSVRSAFVRLLRSGELGAYYGLGTWVDQLVQVDQVRKDTVRSTLPGRVDLDVNLPKYLSRVQQLRRTKQSLPGNGENGEDIHHEICNMDIVVSVEGP